MRRSFQIIDQDGSETVDDKELVHLFAHAGRKISRQQALDYIRVWANNPSAVEVRVQPYMRALALNDTSSSSEGLTSKQNAVESIFTRQQQNKIIRWHLEFNHVSRALASVGELMFTIHTPVSQAAFEWFWPVALGSSGMFVLKVDPNVVMFDPLWWSILPVTVVVFVSLTFGLPLIIGTMLYVYRYELDSVKVLSRLGWMFDRYSPGVEWWGLHEMFRKLLLTSLLIFVPTVSIRVALALVVSFVAVVNLNYFRPFQSSIVFAVSQVANFFTTLKYILAMLRLVQNEVQETVGFAHVLIALDLLCYSLFFLGAVLLVVAAGRAFRSSVLGEDSDGNRSDAENLPVRRRSSVHKKLSKKKKKKKKQKKSVATTEPQNIKEKTTELRVAKNVPEASATKVMPVQKRASNGSDASTRLPAGKEHELTLAGVSSTGEKRGQVVENKKREEEEEEENKSAEPLVENKKQEEENENKSAEPDGDTVEVGVPAGVKPGTMFEMMVNGVKVRARAPNRGRQVVKVNLHRSDWTHLDL